MSRFTQIQRPLRIQITRFQWCLQRPLATAQLIPRPSLLSTPGVPGVGTNIDPWDDLGNRVAKEASERGKKLLILCQRNRFSFAQLCFVQTCKKFHHQPFTFKLTFQSKLHKNFLQPKIVTRYKQWQGITEICESIWKVEKNWKFRNETRGKKYYSQRNILFHTGFFVDCVVSSCIQHFNHYRVVSLTERFSR